MKMAMKKIKTLLCLMLLACGIHANAQLTFFVANDLGRNGFYRQKAVADLMGRYAEEEGPEAVLALGDTHHYMGVESTADPLWMTNYELIYNHPELMVPWLPVLGNHEYRGNTRAVMDYSAVSRRWQMPSRYYSKVFKDENTSIRLVFIDTAPLIDKYRRDSATYPDAASQDIDRQLQWLEKELADATEDWIVVAGHHPIYADTPKDDEERRDMQTRVGPVLRRHRVDMYICGHIHNFQHIRKAGSPIDYIVNSSGSLSRKKVGNIDGTLFVSGEPGFSVIRCTPSELTLTMVDEAGNPIHRVCRRK